MVLQHVVWPNEPETVEKELYYHGTPEYTEDGKLLIKEGEILAFDTYFNCFAGMTWIENTVVTKCEFQVSLCGEGVLYLKEDKGNVIYECPFLGECNLAIPLERIENRVYYLELSAKKDTVFKTGKIETLQSGKEVCLVLVTCTYNRQKDVKRNLEYLKNKNQILLDGEKVLDCVYVVDNARNLELQEKDAVLLPNPNTGGAGGFTRGIKEAMKNPAVTHILLMDDDVKIEFEAIVRTKAILQYIKKEKEESFLGGAMFRRDVPYVLHAAGEVWNNGSIINPYRNTDMRNLQNIEKIIKPLNRPQTYAGWWYCCIPRNHVEKHGYPMQFFLHCDDVEYGLRSGCPPVYMNGIAVWHEEFDDKRNSVMEYYDTRNRLITNAIYMQCGKRRNAVAVLAERFFASALRYRYKDVELLLLAVEDFLKGSEWLAELDAEAYHKKLLEYGYKPHSIEHFQVGSEVGGSSRFWAVLRYLFPASGKVTLKIGALVGSYAGKKEVLLVDIKTGKGFAVRKSWRETISYARQVIWVGAKLVLKYKNIEKQWK